MQQINRLEKNEKLWEALAPEVENGIREHRMENFCLEIRDIDGKPVPGAAVRVMQQTHDFDFGCNCLWLGQLGPLNEAYENRLAELFNLVTTTFCLCDVEPEPGVWRFEEGGKEIFRRPPVERVVKFAKKHGIRLKGQPLLAGSWYPPWAKDQNLSNDRIKALYTDYFKRVAERYGDVFDLFDLVNEAFCHTRFPLYTEKLEYVEWAFKTARPMFPEHVKLSLNETAWVFYNSWEGKNNYYELARRLLDSGAKIDTVGFQFHLFDNKVPEAVAGEGAFSYQSVLAFLRLHAKLGLPMYITEITVPSVFGEIRDEALQAEVIERFYRIFFSIPEMRGVLQWNLCDGTAWQNEGDAHGALVDEFMRKKPAYLALEHLLNREWKTMLAHPADGNGRFEFTGFRGKYEITVEGFGMKRTVFRELGRDSKNIIFTLV